MSKDNINVSKLNNKDKIINKDSNNNINKDTHNNINKDTTILNKSTMANSIM